MIFIIHWTSTRQFLEPLIAKMLHDYENSFLNLYLPKLQKSINVKQVFQ